jgi:hypothetical protein
MRGKDDCAGGMGGREHPYFSVGIGHFIKKYMEEWGVE